MKYLYQIVLTYNNTTQYDNALFKTIDDMKPRWEESKEYLKKAYTNLEVVDDEPNLYTIKVNKNDLYIMGVKKIPLYNSQQDYINYMKELKSGKENKKGV